MENINFVVVFVEGLLSIFSPCILPILPIYLSMLSNSSISDVKDSKFRNSLLFKNTLFFTIGISTTFFILGSSINILGRFINTNKNLIMILGGLIVIIMGLFYVDIIRSNLMSREKRISYRPKEVTPISAFILGFTFSFGWTPCIGPILASVLVMASTSDNAATSSLLIAVYTLGFILPFLIASLFYNKLYKKFDKIKENINIIKKISGVIIIFAGALMFVNGTVGIYKTSNVENIQLQSESPSKNEINNNDSNTKNEEQNKEDSGKKRLAPIDFTLKDQYGNVHTLSEYKGKTVFLNFWATWCPPCKKEMPHIEELYNEYNKNNDDVVILGIASPNFGREKSEEYIKDFLNKENYTFPVVFDTNISLVMNYGINAFPTTFIIDKEGYITKFIPGAMDKNTMQKFIEEER